MSQLPPITPELIRRFSSVQTAHMASRLGCIAEAPGNPAGMETRVFGRATAFCVRGAPLWEFPNFCAGAEIAQLDPILEFYRRAGVPPRFELSPTDLSEELAQALLDRGFYHSRVHTMLYGWPRPQGSGPPPDVTVHEVNQASELEDFLDVTLSAFGLSPENHEKPKVNQRRWLHRPGWLLFLARVHGTPAGGGVLFIHERTAYLAYAGTTEKFRGRGVQAALIEARLARAAELRCDFILGAAYFGSSSQRNQQRAGLNVAYLQSIWKARRAG